MISSKFSIYTVQKMFFNRKLLAKQEMSTKHHRRIREFPWAKRHVPLGTTEWNLQS